MIKKNICCFLFFSLFLFSVEACVRGDVEGALEKSRALAGGISHPDFQALPCAHSTGILIHQTNIPGLIQSYGSGVLITPYHVLTSAHLDLLQNGNRDNIFFSNTAIFDPKICVFVKVSNVVIHPSFKRTKAVPESRFLPYQSDQIDFYRKILSQNFAAVFNETTSLRELSGVDLAILTLEQPINSQGSFSFPRLYTPDDNAPKDQSINSVTFGYGLQSINQPNNRLSIIPRYTLLARHLISNRVFYSEETQIIYGKYETCVWKVDDRSFVIKEGMRKTEGLFVGGDGVAPLYIETGENRLPLLSGIVSMKINIQPRHISETEKQRLKEEVGENTTLPIYPVWTAIWPYMGWIQDVLAPNYVLTDGCFVKASTLSIN